MKNWLALSLLVMSILALATAQSAQGEVWEENEKEVLVRNERGVNNKNPCRYDKGPWTECDFKTNTRSRSLTLKKGDPTCEQTKTIQKKCKKRGCRYEKSAWSQCKENGEMTRTDTLKDNSDAGCEPNRQITKKCNRNKGAKGGKDKGTRRNRQ